MGHDHTDDLTVELPVRRPAARPAAALGFTALTGASVYSAWLGAWPASIAFAVMVLAAQSVLLIRSRRRHRRQRQEVDQLRGTAHAATAWLALNAVAQQHRTRAAIVEWAGTEPPEVDRVLEWLVARGLLTAQWMERPGRTTQRRFGLTSVGHAVLNATLTAPRPRGVARPDTQPRRTWPRSQRR